MNKVKNNHSIKMEKNEKNDEYIKNIEDELKKAKEAATKEPLGFFDYLELEKELYTLSYFYFDRSNNPLPSALASSPKETVRLIICA